MTPVANLPPVSLIPWQFATGVVDTGSKFAAGIVDTGGKFATAVNNTRGTGGKILLPVSSTPVVHLDLRISLRIFEKIRNDPYVSIRGLGEGDS
jgi:hypothetical protein